MKTVLLVVFILILCSCQTVSIDFRPDVDFSKYKTFGFVPSNESKSLNRQRLEAALINGLELKDMTFIHDSSITKPADLLIKPSYQVISSERIVTMHGGMSHRNYYAGSDYYFVESDERYLLVNFIDTKTNEVVWQGSSPGFNHISVDQAKFSKIINEMLSFYPPTLQ